MQQAKIERFDFFSLRDFALPADAFQADIITDNPPTQDNEAEIETPAENAEPAPPPATFSEEEMAEARAKARHEGHAEGIKEGREQIDKETMLREKALMQAIEKMVGTLGRMNQEHQQTLSSMQQDTKQLAYEIARSILGDALAKAPEVPILSIAEECMQLLIDEPKIVMALHPSQAEVLQDKLKQIANRNGYEGTLDICPDDTIESSDCQITWKDGTASSNLGQTWEIIREKLGLREMCNEALPPPDQPEQPNPPTNDKTIGE